MMNGLNVLTLILLTGVIGMIRRRCHMKEWVIYDESTLEPIETFWSYEDMDKWIRAHKDFLERREWFYRDNCEFWFE
jgi:hypothetical protein